MLSKDRLDEIETIASDLLSADLRRVDRWDGLVDGRWALERCLELVGALKADTDPHDPLVVQHRADMEAAERAVELAHPLVTKHASSFEQREWWKNPVVLRMLAMRISRSGSKIGGPKP